MRAFCALIVLTVFATSAFVQDRLPEAPGKAEFVTVCSGCHEAEIVFAHQQTAGEWAGTLQDMRQTGAEATPDQWRLVEQYVYGNLALIRINDVEVEELQATMQVTRETAAAIVKYRQDHGKFKDLEDLKKVPGLEPAKVDARKDRFIF